MMGHRVLESEGGDFWEEDDYKKEWRYGLAQICNHISPTRKKRGRGGMEVRYDGETLQPPLQT